MIFFFLNSIIIYMFFLKFHLDLKFIIFRCCSSVIHATPTDYEP